MRVGFIGAGFISKFQAIAMKQVRGLEVAGILKRSQAKPLAAFCREQGLGEAVLYDSIGEMANHVDVLAIYAPNDVRVAIMEEIVAAVKSGAELKGLICEKPLGRNMRPLFGKLKNVITAASRFWWERPRLRKMKLLISL